MITKEEAYKAICEATEKAENDDWYSAIHDTKMQKIEELKKEIERLKEEDHNDLIRTRNKYLREAGFMFIDEEPDPFKRVFLRCMRLAMLCKNAKRA